MPPLDETDPLLRVVRQLARAGTRYHRGTLEGEEHLPKGPALLVGNHGLFGLETPVFFYLLHHATGRFPIGLADRVFFGSRPIQSVLQRIGGVLGTAANALEQLSTGQLVVCYPGGSREVFKGQGESYRLNWNEACGFARIALRAQVPIIPFAGLGIDDSFVNFGHPPLSRRLFGRYAIPMAMGLGPMPLPARFTFRLGRPIQPPQNFEDEGVCEALRDQTRRAIERLLETDEHPASQPVPAFS